MTFQEWLQQWQKQAQANMGATAKDFVQPQQPYSGGAPGGAMQDLEAFGSRLVPGIGRALAAPVDILGAIPGVSEVNRYLYGNRGMFVGEPSRQVKTNSAPETPATPANPVVETPSNAGVAIMAGGGARPSGGSSREGFWAKPNFRRPEEFTLDAGFQAASDAMRQRIEELQAEIMPENGWGGFDGLPGEAMRQLTMALLNYGKRADWGDVAQGVQTDQAAREEAKVRAMQLGLEVPKLDMAMAEARQGVANQNLETRNQANLREDTAGYEYGRDTYTAGRQQLESDRAYGLQRESLAAQIAASNRAAASQKTQEDINRLMLAMSFGGPQADRMLAERAFGAGTPEAASVMRTRVLGAVRGIAADSRGVRSLNQLLEQGGAGIKIKNRNDTQGLNAAAGWLQANPQYLDAMAGMMGYAPPVEANLRR